MAYSVRIKGVSKDKEQVLLDLQPFWWNTNELKRDKRFIESDDNTGYLDYIADLSLEEMRTLHERFREEATTSFHKDLFQPMLKELDEALYSRFDDYSHFHIKVYEWETGLSD